MSNVTPPSFFTSSSSTSIDDSSATAPVKQLDNENPTTEEKRDIIKNKLKNNFPVKTVLSFGMAFIAVGVAAISLDVALITFKAVNYQLGNGVWAGCSSILNGLTKLNQFRTRGYASHVIAQVVTPYLTALTSIGLTLLSSITLRQYDCPSENCVPRDLAIILTMLVLGFVTLVMNITFMIVFNGLLFGGRKRARSQKLGFFEAYREFNYILKS